MVRAFWELRQWLDAEGLSGDLLSVTLVFNDQIAVDRAKAAMSRETELVVQHKGKTPANAIYGLGFKFEARDL